MLKWYPKVREYDYKVNELKKNDEDRINSIIIPGMKKWNERYKKKEEYWLKHKMYMRGKTHKVFKPYYRAPVFSDLKSKQPKVSATAKSYLSRKK